MSTIKANDIQNASGGIPTVKGQRLIPTAWVNFNGTGTVAIRDSENVSSITDVSTGEYRINYATVMANVNYSAFANFQRQTTWSGSGIEARGGADRTTAYVQINVLENQSTYDALQADVIVLGGQA